MFIVQSSLYATKQPNAHSSTTEIPTTTPAALTTISESPPNPTASVPPTKDPLASTPGATTATRDSPPNPTASTSAPPTKHLPTCALCCYCQGNTTNVTKEELDEIVETLVKNLTIDVTETSSFIRSKTSAPDQRTSSKVVGTVGIAVMVTSGFMVVAMDCDHILRAVIFLKDVWAKFRAK